MKLRNLLNIVVVLAMLLLAACQSAPAPVEQAPTQAEQAAAPTQAEQAAAPAAEGTLAAPVPYEPSKALAGSREPKTFDVDQIVEFKKFDQYCEAPYLTKLVEEGKLPPVAERLPEEPFVYKTEFMSDGIGQYGGIWRDVWAVPLEGWNYDAGAVQGWFGIEAIVQEEPFNTGAMFLTKNVNVIPRLATGYEWSEDGKTLTINLIKGVKWSDGQPFTTEDIRFLWEDNIQDPNVQTWTNSSFWQIDGTPIELKVVDDYTFQMVFPVEKPEKWLYQFTNLQFSPGPAHILKPFHPKYGGKDYQSYRDALAPNALPVVTLGPWVPVDYKTDEFLVFRRNPYFYMVDENGCQLPYLDEVQFTYSKTGNTRTLNTMAGTADHSNVENIETMDEVVRKTQDPNATFRVEWGPETLGFDLTLNQSNSLGIESDRDQAVRDLFRNPTFRQAVAYAIDREGLAKSATNSPLFRPWAGGLFPGSAYFDANAIVYYPYSPESAKMLLDELGLVDSNGDGIREFADGPMKGQNIELALTVGEDNTAGPVLGPALVLFLQEIGIKVNYRQMAGTAMTEANNTGKWDMQIGRPGQAWAAPNVRCNQIAPLASSGDTALNWHRYTEPIADDEFVDFEKQLIDIASQFCLENDPAKQRELLSEYQKIFTENNYQIGLIVFRYGLMLNKFFKNIPIGTPAFLYQWDANNILPEQVWFAPEDAWNQGQKEIYPDSVPYYEGCDYQTTGAACVMSPAQ